MPVWRAGTGLGAEELLPPPTAHLCLDWNQDGGKARWTLVGLRAQKKQEPRRSGPALLNRGPCRWLEFRIPALP